MKRRIQRLSPHQNGKVAGLMMALVSLVILVPFMLILGSIMPHGERMPWLMVLILPVLYLVLGYIGTVLACWVYNLVAGWVGGIEYDAQEV
ncbi:MAG: hypothetical protein KatS3mg122_0091 [Caldimonas sp.]|uniref:hypothetical protein n=1 Tax=Caldimonas taiwanensis TaxID=307483 RepID=UPI00078307B3|nr:hypothetical protein [Caldimonas taiwanensis]GIX22860.1 MAG: hypothetical protein KatS3mg122_0091 [Caldimonas sp.]